MRNRLFPTILLLQHRILLQHAKAFQYSSKIFFFRHRRTRVNNLQLLETTLPRKYEDFYCTNTEFYGVVTRCFSSGVPLGDSVTENENERTRVYEAFSVLAKTKKSWQRLGHLVELAADHTINDSKGTSGGRSIADVGTDHGLLAMSFALSGRYERVLGVDVSKQALQNGALSLLDSVTQVFEQQRGKNSSDGTTIEERIPISLRVSNGFERIEEGEADTVCIAGMRVNTMIKILSMPSDAVATSHLDRIQCQQLLLQPTNSRPSNLILLYDHLQKSGWTLVDERIEELSKRWYISSCFQRKAEDDGNTGSGEEPRTTTDLPASKLVNLQTDAPMYPAFQKYVGHHCQWIERDAKARGELKDADARWLKAFQQLLSTRD